MLAEEKSNELCYELFPHPSVPLDLVSRDSFCFQAWLNKRFGFNEEIIAKTNAHLEDLDNCFQSGGVKILEKSWTKCMELLETFFLVKNCLLLKKLWNY